MNSTGLGKRIAYMLCLTIACFSFKDPEPKVKSAATSYFLDVAFYNDQIIKWSGPIYVEVRGTLNSKQSAMIDSLVSITKTAIGKDKIARVPVAGNFVIHFTKTLKEYQAMYTEDLFDVPLGYAKTFQYADKSIRETHIFLHPSLLKEKQNQVLKHEWCHALGLLSHTRTPFAEENMLSASLYTTVKPGTAALPALDREALRYLYNKGIFSGNNRSEVIQKLNLLP